LYYDRGIKMCRRWFNSFAAFLKDMGERPESMTLDRKNPDKDYTKSNCRWADATTQTNNRRKQRYVKRPTLRMPLVWESNRTPLVTTVTDSGASDQLLEKRGYMKYMTEETMNELKQTEKAYDAAIAAATNETHKAGLEKLKGFISDAIDHELFDRAEGRDCQIKYVSGDSDVGMPCGKPAVASCGDCGSAICSDCQQECCGDSFCGQCYEYHERLPV